MIIFVSLAHDERIRIVVEERISVHMKNQRVSAMIQRLAFHQRLIGAAVRVGAGGASIAGP